MKILIKRDTIEAFKTTSFIPREYELVAAYDNKTKQVIYKLGDGVTPWSDLKEITKICELDKFMLYSHGITKIGDNIKIRNNKTFVGPEIYLNPFMINEIIGAPNAEEDDCNDDQKTFY